MKRYSRNFNSISKENQTLLSKSTIAIVGLGGLGGYVLENLVRLGVGKFHLIDNDAFDESNLNRQTLSLENNIGKHKVNEAYKRAKAINNNVKAKIFLDTLNRNSFFLLEDVDIVIDCLDSVKSRIELEFLCDKLDLILIHGAIGGYFGQVALSSPGNRIFHKIYGKSYTDNDLGNLPMTCMVTASIQTTLALKVLFKEKIKKEFISIDVEDFEFFKTPL